MLAKWDPGDNPSNVLPKFNFLTHSMRTSKLVAGAHTTNRRDTSGEDRYLQERTVLWLSLRQIPSGENGTLAFIKTDIWIQERTVFDIHYDRYLVEKTILWHSLRHISTGENSTLVFIKANISGENGALTFIKTDVFRRQRYFDFH